MEYNENRETHIVRTNIAATLSYCIVPQVSLLNV